MPAATPPSERILKKPMSPVRCDVGAAAQFARAADVHHADAVAVLLAEQRHGAGLHRVVEGHHAGARLGVGEDLAVDDLLDGADLVGGHRRLVGEVEARAGDSTSEPFCCTWLPSTSRRALCMRWVAEWLRTVAAREARSTFACTVLPTVSLPSFTDALVAEDVGLDLLRVVDGEGAVGGFEQAAVADLAAGFGVERRVVEHHHAGLARSQFVHLGAVPSR
jgi:hypothetical protein